MSRMHLVVSRTHRSMIALGSLLAAACATTEPPLKLAEPAAPEKSSPTSAEWLFSTDGVAGGTRAECAAVVTRLDDEDRCKGALCSHGAVLASDWLRACKSVSPALVDRIEAKAGALKKKAARAPAPCEEQILGVLRDGCGRRADCAAFAQSWATSCSEWTTPLVIRMVEVAVERQGGERVRLDARGCGELLAELGKGWSCTQQFKCEDHMGAIDTWRARCVSAERPPDLGAAILELAIRSGAGQKPAPVAVMAGGPKLDAKSAKVPLDDGTGAVLMACGKRPSTVDEYLEIRRSCGEGEVVVARLFEDKGGSVVRLGHFAHSSDRAFQERFPSLVVDGEYQRRYQSMLPGFLSAVDRAIALGGEGTNKKDAVKALVTALAQHRDAVSTSSTFEEALQRKDEALAPLFRIIGEAKRAVFSTEPSEERLLPALRRAQSLPLADVGADGKAKVGAFTAAASLELDDPLPKAMAAYRAAIAPRAKFLQKREPSGRTQQKLAALAETEIGRCASSSEKSRSAERSLLACGFGLEQCDEARVTQLGEQLVQAERDLSESWPKTRLAIASMGEESSSAARQAARDAGCKEPWW